MDIAAITQNDGANNETKGNVNDAATVQFWIGTGADRPCKKRAPRPSRTRKTPQGIPALGPKEQEHASLGGGLPRSSLIVPAATLANVARGGPDV